MVPFHLLIITRVKNFIEPSLSSELHKRDIQRQVTENEMKASRTGSIWL
ncbi:hypothetical protein [Alkalihalobacillus sp. CinArs1]|nr:hypothetical protein [Alkalihalobacillus sp. CinArs1]